MPTKTTAPLLRPDRGGFARSSSPSSATSVIAAHPIRGRRRANVPILRADVKGRRSPRRSRCRGFPPDARGTRASIFPFARKALEVIEQPRCPCGGTGRRAQSPKSCSARSGGPISLRAPSQYLWIESSRGFPAEFVPPPRWVGPFSKRLCPGPCSMCIAASASRLLGQRRGCRLSLAILSVAQPKIAIS